MILREEMTINILAACKHCRDQLNYAKTVKHIDRKLTRERTEANRCLLKSNVTHHQALLALMDRRLSEDDIILYHSNEIYWELTSSSLNGLDCKSRQEIINEL